MENSQNESRGLITKSIIAVKGTAKVGEDSIEETQTAEVNDTAFLEQKLIQLIHCPCGAVLHDSKDVSGVGTGGELLCAVCQQIKCCRCDRSVGICGLKLFGSIYCKRCLIRVLIIIAVIATAIIAVGFLIFR